MDISIGIKADINPFTTEAHEIIVISVFFVLLVVTFMLIFISFDTNHCVVDETSVIDGTSYWFQGALNSPSARCRPVIKVNFEIIYIDYT